MLSLLYYITVLCLLGVTWYQFVKRTKADRQEYEELYQVFYHHPITAPLIEVQRIKWWPVFTVTFYNEPDYNYAHDNGLLDIFNNRIKKFYDKGFPLEHVVRYRWKEDKKQ